MAAAARRSETSEPSKRRPEPGPQGLSAVVVHISDTHFGRDDPAAIAALRAAIEQIGPDLVVAGGDISHRARKQQLRAARVFLDSLPAPWLAVPGNHDVPLYDLFRRVFFPLSRFHRYITDERAPRRQAGELRVLGLDSTRRKVTGRLRAEQIALITDADVLVTHHPIVRRPLEGAPAALQAARAAGVEVLLAGHHHRLHIIDGDPIHVEAPSPSHILEPRKGFVVLRANRAEIVVEPWWLVGAAYVADPPQRFLRNARVTQR